MKLYPGGKRLALTLSYDDDTAHDIRLVEILNKNALKCTFNLNAGCFRAEKPKDASTNRSMTLEEAVALFKNGPHEVATHGFTHPFYPKLTAEEKNDDIKKDIALLSEAFGKKIDGHAYPFGDYDNETISVLSSNGIRYARTVKSTKEFELPDELMAWHPTCHHKNEELFELWEKFVNSKDGEPKLFYLWGHAFEFNNDNNWDRIEKFAALAGSRDDVWFCTNGEFCDWLASNE